LLQIKPLERCPARRTRAEPAAADLLKIRSVTVVGLPLFGITEDIVGLLNPLELFLGLVIVGIHVRVILAGHLSIGLLNLLLISLTAYT
jgi:hypothetical protein